MNWLILFRSDIDRSGILRVGGEILADGCPSVSQVS